MNTPRRIIRTFHARRQAGLSLVELLVAVAIALFIVAGVGVVFVNMKRAFVSQDQLAQLQDSERLALTMLTTSVQQAGYFPDPTNNDPKVVLPASPAGSSPAFAAGQAVSGFSGSAGGSDTISTRYATQPGDGLMNCLGGSNTGGSVSPMTNTFTVNTSSELTCSTDGITATPLVSNVASLSVSYGTDVNGDGSTYRYLTASQVTDWTRVKTARITVNFQNPYGGQPISWVQVVSLMNKT